MQRRIPIRLAMVAAAGAIALIGASNAPGDAAAGNVTATTLRVATLADPIGLGDATPNLSWRLSSGRQTAYEIRVASSEAQLASPDLWDSGKVELERHEQRGLRRRAASSRKSVTWEVRVWDGSGAAGDWSAPASWEMGLLANSDWTAKWIENPDYTYATNGVPNPLPIFGKAFDSSGQVAKARLYMTGLGQYAAELNGQPVGNAVLEPGQTSYWSEVDYRAYDITQLLRQGTNVLGIETGSGAYQQADTTSVGRYMFQPGNNTILGAPKVIAQLELTYADGSSRTIATDASWLTKLGPTTFSSWWGGEDYDAQRIAANWTASADNLADGGWRQAGPATLTSSTIPTDTAQLVADPRLPVMVAREAHPTSVTQVTPAAANTTIVAPLQAGATNVNVASVTNLYPGDTVTLDSGAGAETRTVTSVGTAAGPATTLAAPAAAGDTNVKVASTGSACNPGACVGTTSFVVGQTFLIDSGADQQAVTVTAVGTSGASGTGVSFTPALAAPHAQGATVRRTGTGVTFSPAASSAHAAGAPVTSVPGPTYVLDFGMNLSGLPNISGSGPAGTTVTMIPAETANADGTINVGSTGASATNQILYRYTFSGDGAETWHSQFTYNGLRYLQVRGLAQKPTADTITLLVTHASSRETASFDSSSPLLDSIYDITKRALENNMQSVLTDCPDREKGPYTGDNLHNIDTELTLFDMQAYQGQLVNNMRTSQRPTPLSSDSPGLIANIAPEYHIVPPILFGRNFLDEPNWGAAVIMIPWNLYMVYGDTKAMRDNYDAMVKWLDYEARTKAANNGNITGLGDWSAAQSTDAQPVIDYGYYRGASTMAKIAALLGKTADADTYSQLEASLRDEYNAKYLHTDSGGNAWYANNTEASNALALDAGLVPAQYHDAVVNSLVAAVHAFGDRIGTGSVAIGALFRMLHAAGRDDVIYTMVANPASPGYAFLVNSGKTTLTESLSGGGSQDHHFLGEVDSWFVHGLVGIQQAPGSVAYKSLEIRPALVGDLNHAEGTYTTPQGDAAASWTRADNGLLSSLAVTVPPNTTARVYVPTSSPSETFVANGAAGVTYVGYQNGAQVYDVTSGATTFVHGTSTGGSVGGSVPATLSLSLGSPAAFGAFTPGVDRNYDASTTANVISTAGDATLSVTDPSSNATGRLVNGAFALSEPLQARANTGAFAPLSTTAGSPLTLLTYTGPVSNDTVTIGFRQHISSTQPLRTGSYSKTLTFTLSTTNP